MWQSLSEMSSLQIDGQILQKTLFLCYPFWEGLHPINSGAPLYQSYKPAPTAVERHPCVTSQENPDAILDPEPDY